MNYPRILALFSQEVSSSFAKDKRIFVIDKSNSGYGDSMNTGLAETKTISARYSLTRLDRIVKMRYNDCGKTVAILTEIPVPKKRKSGRAPYGRKK